MDPSKKILKIYATKKQGVFVKNLSSEYCDNYQDVLKLLDAGKKMRIVASTKMNS